MTNAKSNRKHADIEFYIFERGNCLGLVKTISMNFKNVLVLLGIEDPGDSS